jgi:hypothetical protein
MGHVNIESAKVYQKYESSKLDVILPLVVWCSATHSELRAVKKLVSKKSGQQYWCGPFRLPTDGEVTTEYGLKRYYNGVFASG